MKIGALGILILLFSCQSSQDKTIVGSWQLIGSKYGTGAEIFSNKINSDYVLSFSENGEYTEFNSSKKTTKKYLINKSDFLVLIDFKTADTIYYSYHLDGNNLILDQVDRNGSFMCDEGCSSIFKRAEK